MEEEQEMQEGFNISVEHTKSLWNSLERARLNYSIGNMAGYFHNLNALYKAITFRIEPDEIEKFDELCKAVLLKRKYWDVFSRADTDTLQEQSWIEELVSPRKFSKEDIIRGKIEFCELAENFQRELQNLLKKIGVLN